MPNCEYFQTHNDYKEVIIIGNGPSGLCTSYMLAGNWPYWNKKKVLDEYLQMRLDSLNNENSLIEQDLEFLSDGLEGRSQNPIALLYDSLKNPGSDMGFNLDSCLDWKYDSSKEIDHLVIGKTPPGGAWNTFDGDQLTISLNRWMELPDLRFNKFKKETYTTKESQYQQLSERATANDVRDYYQFYVKKKNLEKYLLNYATVTNIRKIVSLFSCYNLCNNELWEVSGFVQSNNNKDKYEFRFLCKHLILAVGAAGLYNELNVKGENYNFILHSINDLEDKIKTNLSYLRKYPLIVVGAGLSAADCILLALKYRIKVVHVIRRSVFDKNIVYQKLPKILYPEYHLIYEKMKEYKQQKKSTDMNYILYDEHRINRFNANHTCAIQPKEIFEDDFDGEIEIKFSFACLLIGQKVNLGFIEPDIRSKLAYDSKRDIDVKNNPISINPYTYETSNFQNLYALGPLVGDNFVRFGTAGALGITNHLWKSKNKCFD